MEVKHKSKWNILLLWTGCSGMSMCFALAFLTYLLSCSAISSCLVTFTVLVRTLGQPFLHETVAVPQIYSSTPFVTFIPSPTCSSGSWSLIVELVDPRASHSVWNSNFNGVGEPWFRCTWRVYYEVPGTILLCNLIAVAGLRAARSGF
jgi:hypothetical protein